MPSTKVIAATIAAVLMAVATDLNDAGVPATAADWGRLIAKALGAGVATFGAGWTVADRTIAPSSRAVALGE